MELHVPFIDLAIDSEALTWALIVTASALWARIATLVLTAEREDRYFGRRDKVLRRAR